jgi:hypothetical protein
LEERREETGHHWVAALARSPSKTTVIVIDHCADDYSLTWIEFFWRRIVREECCPHCGEYGRFRRHGTYEKYYYRQLIQILRVRCAGCKNTHAVMPSFSLPGTSVGAAEAEAFVLQRESGASRARAGEGFLGRGMGTEYLRSLERRLVAGVHQARALFPERESHGPGPWRRLIDMSGTHLRPIFELNRSSIAAGWGAVFCSLTLGAGRRLEKPGRRSSHNKHSARSRKGFIDSG